MENRCCDVHGSRLWHFLAGAYPSGTWVKRLIDDSWSQPHAMTLIDFRGNGNLGLLTGKRFMAHNGHDPGEREPLGIYWYERW